MAPCQGPVGLGVASTSVAWLKAPPAAIVDRMNKRLVAGVLWLFAGWYLGNLLAFTFGLGDLLGPTLGVVAGLMISADPFHLLWDRAATGRTSDRDPAGSAATD